MIFFQKILEFVKREPKESLYIQILLWAYDRLDFGFTSEELEKKFNLNPAQTIWVRKVFFTTSDSDRKFFEHLRNDDSTTPNRHYYTLNEKGISAAVGYKNLKEAEKNSLWAFYIAIGSILLNFIGLYFAYKQTSYTELQSRSDRIQQNLVIQEAIKNCKQKSPEDESGLYVVSSGKIANCGLVLESYEK